MLMLLSFEFDLTKWLVHQIFVTNETEAPILVQLTELFSTAARTDM
jgi:hypothetical protein